MKFCDAANPDTKKQIWDDYFDESEDSMTSKWGLHNYNHSFNGFKA